MSVNNLKKSTSANTDTTAGQNVTSEDPNEIVREFSNNTKVSLKSSQEKSASRVTWIFDLHYFVEYLQPDEQRMVDKDIIDLWDTTVILDNLSKTFTDAGLESMREEEDE